jgi:hypothetical protein
MSGARDGVTSARPTATSTNSTAVSRGKIAGMTGSVGHLGIDDAHHAVLDSAAIGPVTCWVLHAVAGPESP